METVPVIVIRRLVDMVEFLVHAGRALNWEIESNGFGFNNKELKQMREQGDLKFAHGDTLYILSYHEFKKFNERNITDFLGMHYYPIELVTVLGRRM